jgi:hypothetical protein
MVHGMAVHIVNFSGLVNVAVVYLNLLVLTLC